VTCDNASANDTAMKEFANRINARLGTVEEYDAVEHHIRYSLTKELRRHANLCMYRCQEHCTHLICGAFTKDVSPGITRKLATKIRRAISCTEDSVDDIDIDTLDRELASVLGGEGGDEDDASDDEDDEDAIGDAVAKCMALIRQVCAFIWCTTSFSESNSYRFANPLQQMSSFNNAASKLTSPLSNYFYGFKPDGLLFIRRLIVLSFFKRYNNSVSVTFSLTNIFRP
jgi:hypothetical protein